MDTTDIGEEQPDDAAYDEALADVKLESMFTDLTSVDTSEPRAWVPGAEGILHTGMRTSYFGPRGCGKSVLSLMQSIQIVEAGGSVVYIDLENGPRRMAERLDAILSDRPSTTRQEVQERLHYASNFRFTALREMNLLAAWIRMLGKIDVLYVDSWTRALGQEDLNEEKTTEIQRWTRDYVDLLLEQHPDLTVVILDNTGYSATKRNRGASGKQDLLELCYLIDGGNNCKPTKHGTITMELTRARDGDEAEWVAVGAGGGQYDRIEPSEKAVPTDGMLAQVVEVLQAAGEPLSKNAIGERLKLAEVKFRKDTLNKSLDEWALVPDSGVEKDSKQRFSTGSGSLEPLGGSK